MHCIYIRSLFISSRDSLGCANRVRLRADPFRSIEARLTLHARDFSAPGGTRYDDPCGEASPERGTVKPCV